MTPLYGSYWLSKIRARSGAFASPAGAGTRATMASRISAIPMPSLALARSTSSRGIPSVSSSSSVTLSGSADGRSILLTTGMIVRFCARAR